jgi:hypothetical protein
MDKRMTRREWIQGAALGVPMLAGAWPAAPAWAQAGYAEADLAVARQLIEQASRSDLAWRLVSELAGGIGARPAGSEGDRRAVAWAQKALANLGLQGVTTQRIELSTWQRGPASAQLAGASARDLVVAALGNSVSTPAQGVEAEVAWYPSLAALMEEPADPAKSRARGRIVFVDQRTERTRDGTGYGRSVGARVAGPVEAARRGALAYGLRSVGTSGGSAPSPDVPTNAERDRLRVAHTGTTRYDLRVPMVPAFAVSVADADVMAAQVAAGATLRMKVNLQNRSEVPGETHNVLADIPGTDLAQEVVLIGAHLDSWDLGQGAVDDGAGVAIVSAAAGLMVEQIRAMGRRPRRTVRVVLFANEENGFDGAMAYGKAYADVAHQLVAESDFGGGRIYRLSSRVQPAALPLFEQMAELLKPLEVEAGDNNGNPGPDAAMLMRNHRWPALQLHQDGTRYFDVHHTERDTLDQLNQADLQQNVACWAAVTWLAAQAPVSFSPLPDLPRR